MIDYADNRTNGKGKWVFSSQLQRATVVQAKVTRAKASGVTCRSALSSRKGLCLGASWERNHGGEWARLQRLVFLPLRLGDLERTPYPSHQSMTQSPISRAPAAPADASRVASLVFVHSRNPR